MGFPLLNSQAEITQAVLAALQLGTYPPDGSLACNTDWPIYFSNEPSEPDNCITVYDSVNQYDGRSMKDGELWIHWGVLIRIRSQTHATGYQKSLQIIQALSQRIGGNAGNLGVYCQSNYTGIGPGNYYLVDCFTKIRGPLVLGKDAPRSKRSLFTVNAFLVL